jgi:hypothetical protein
MISKNTAKQILNNLQSNCINKAFDVWLKEQFNDSERYASVPLFCFHSSYDLNIYDSDTWGIGVPINSDETEIDKIKLPTFSFLIPSYLSYQS